MTELSILSRSFRSRGWVASMVFVMGGALILAGCGDAPQGDEPAARSQGPSNSIVEVAQVAGQFSALLRAAEAAGLAETLHEDGPFTVFAPTDGAFADLPEGVLDDLMDDPDALAEILLYHVVSGEYRLEELRGMSEIETLQGGFLVLEDGPRGLRIDGSNTLTTNVGARNGIIHVITEVLTPGGG